MLSTVYTMSDHSKAWELINSRKRPCPGRDESLSVVAPSGGSGGGGFNYSRDDSLCVVASSGRSNGRGFMYGYGDPESVLDELSRRHDLHKTVMTKDGLRVESTAGGAAHAMREMTTGESEKMAFMKAMAGDDARRIASLENTISELSTKNDDLIREDRKNKVVMTQLTDTAEVLMVKLDDTKGSLQIALAALRASRRNGWPAADFYLKRNPGVHAMLDDDVSSGV